MNNDDDKIPSQSFGPNSKLPADQQQRNHNMVKAGLKNLKYNPSKKHVTDAMKVVDKANSISFKVTRQIEPILKAGGWKDKDGIGALISNLYVEAFDSHLLFSREELVQLCTMLYTREMMIAIEADPTLSGTPDLLGGL